MKPETAALARQVEQKVDELIAQGWTRDEFAAALTRLLEVPAAAQTPAPVPVRTPRARCSDIMVTIPVSAWEPVGLDGNLESTLLAALMVNGVSMHVEACEVQTTKGGQQVAVNPNWFDKLTDLQTTMDCQFQTTMINGREYVLIITPYGN